MTLSNEELSALRNIAARLQTDEPGLARALRRFDVTGPDRALRRLLQAWLAVAAALLALSISMRDPAPLILAITLALVGPLLTHLARRWSSRSQRFQ